ncbi:MAG: response regulator [Ignavibacteria bacterium]
MYRLLIIEDEEVIRDNIKELFEQDNNETYIAADGTEGIKMAARLIPDIIICDIMMPGINGFQVKMKLDENKCTQNIPFIYLTAKADIESMREGMNLGADDYIVKPVRNKELLDIVYNRLQRIKDIGAKSIKNSNGADNSSKLTLEDKIILNCGKEQLLVALNDILFIDVMENYTNVNMADGKKAVQKKTLKSWEEILPEKTFIRVHHTTIINFNYVEKIEQYPNGSLILKVRHHRDSIICSNRYSKKIKKLFNK